MDLSFVEALRGQHNILGECIVQLRAAESSRATLVSHLKEALQEQENELEQVRTQLQSAKSLSEQAGNICQRLTNSTSGQLLPEQKLKEANRLSDLTSTFAHENLPTIGDKERSASVMYTRQLPTLPNSAPQIEEDPRKSAAASVVAKLTASTSSAEMLTFVLSSLASGGVISNPVKDLPMIILQKRGLNTRMTTHFSIVNYHHLNILNHHHFKILNHHHHLFHIPIHFWGNISHHLHHCRCHSHNHHLEHRHHHQASSCRHPNLRLVYHTAMVQPHNGHNHLFLVTQCRGANYQGSRSSFYSHPPQLPATPPISRQ